MSIEENLVQNAAERMIKRYGDSALMEVDLRITELESHHQQDALMLWKEIRNRVKLLMKAPSSNASH